MVTIGLQMMLLVVFLDFDLREVKYSRNGRLLGVAFKDVPTFNALVPCCSLKRGSKFSVNFGPNFSYQPPSYYGFNALAPDPHRKLITTIFETYCKKGLALDQSQNLETMYAASIQALVTDLGATSLTDPHFLLLAWRLRPKEFLAFTSGEWLLLWSNERITSFEEMKAAVNRWNKEVKADENVFMSFYSFVFDYMRLEKGERNTVLEKNDAKMAWDVLDIKSRFKYYDEWIRFWQENDLKGINKDTWMMLLVFIKKLGNNVKNYDTNDCWPTCFDDFVYDYLMPK